MILADGMLGQMMEPVELPERKDTKASRKAVGSLPATKMKETHNIINSLYLTPNALEDLVRARYERYKIVEEKEQRAEEYLHGGRGCHRRRLRRIEPVWRAAPSNKAREAGMKVGLIRPITLWPFPKARNQARGRSRQRAARCGDEHGPDGRRCAVLRQSCQCAGALLRPHRRRDSHPEGSVRRDR